MSDDPRLGELQGLISRRKSHLADERVAQLRRRLAVELRNMRRIESTFQLVSRQLNAGAEVDRRMATGLGAMRMDALLVLSDAAFRLSLQRICRARRDLFALEQEMGADLVPRQE